MENSIIGLTTPSPPFMAKIMENFEKYQLFYGLKKWSSIEINCIFWIMEFDIADPPPPTNYYFNFLNEGFP